MPIHFVCPHCGAATEVDDQYAGASGPCATCGRTIDVPPLAAGAGSGEGAKGEASRRTARGMSAATILLIAAGALVAGALLVVLLIALFYPAIRAVGDANKKTRCSEGLHRIGRALMSYEADHGTFPPAYLADEDGKPMHSWRVLILPYLDEGMLYEQYNFDEPWDGPNNILLSNQMPDCFGCPADPEAASMETSYMVIVGPGTMFPGAEAVGRGQCLDGMNITLCVVEVANSSIAWTEPVDLDAGKMTFEITAGSQGEIGSNHPGGAHVLYCDGSVLFLPNTTSPDELEAYSTRAGGEEYFPMY